MHREVAFAGFYSYTATGMRNFTNKEIIVLLIHLQIIIFIIIQLNSIIVLQKKHMFFNTPTLVLHIKSRLNSFHVVKIGRNPPVRLLFQINNFHLIFISVTLFTG